MKKGVIISLTKHKSVPWYADRVRHNYIITLSLPTLALLLHNGADSPPYCLGLGLMPALAQEIWVDVAHATCKQNLWMYLWHLGCVPLAAAPGGAYYWDWTWEWEYTWNQDELIPGKASRTSKAFSNPKPFWHTSKKDVFLLATEIWGCLLL